MRVILGSFLAALIVIAWSGAVSAQTSPLDNRWPRETSPKPQQAEPAPPQPPASDTRKPASPKLASRKPVAAKPGPNRAPALLITCNEPIAPDASEAKVAAVFGADNVTWTQVDGPAGSKLNASVLFPQDPKRRLEVLWQSDDTRTGTRLVAINGKSSWIAPKGVKLGLTPAALQRINGRPFTLRGFGGDHGGEVTDWQGGALATLPGGCRIGARFAAGSRRAPGADLVGDKDIASNAPSLRRLAPTVAEIVIGYGGGT